MRPATYSAEARAVVQNAQTYVMGVTRFRSLIVALKPVGQLPQQFPGQGLGFGRPDAILGQLAGPVDEEALHVVGASHDVLLA
jgi:hypothetical protein